MTIATEESSGRLPTKLKSTGDHARGTPSPGQYQASLSTVLECDEMLDYDARLSISRLVGDGLVRCCRDVIEEKRHRRARTLR